MYEPTPLHEVTIGHYILTPEGQVWAIDCEESLAKVPEVSFFYQSHGEQILAFEHFWQANYYFHRN